MNRLTPQSLGTKELSTFYRIRFCEKVKDNFMSLPFDEAWPPLPEDLKSSKELAGWRSVAVNSLRESAKSLMSGHKVGREEEAAGCFFLASEVLAHPEFTKKDFIATMENWTKNKEYHFSLELQSSILDSLQIAQNVMSVYISKHLTSFEDSAEDLKALIFKSKAIDPLTLTADQKAIKKFSEEVFGLDVKFFKGLDELHGRFDNYANAIYVNADTPSDIDWAFWHAAFHSLKELDARLYDDLLDATKKANVFSREDIVKYRMDIKQPHMTESAVIEEMLADAFADLKTNRRPVIKLAGKRTGAAARLMRYAKSAVGCIAKVLDEDDSQLLPYQDYATYPKISLNDEQFAAFADRIDKLTHQVLQMDLPKSFTSTAYQICTADGKYLGAKLLLENLKVYRSDLYSDYQQQKFDFGFIREAGTTPELVVKALEANSPLAVRAGYVKSIVPNAKLSHSDVSNSL